VTSRLLADRYRLGDEIGRGGMSTVVEAIDERLGRQVAVKILELDEASSPGSIERFRREAKIAASLNHPNIVTVFDTGVDGTTAFLVMELLAGPTLARKVARTGKLGVPEILDTAEQVCRALTAAHAAGVVHRDIKPSNIANAGNDTVKVLDFGVARMIEEATGLTELTRTSTIVGTAAYISPEQARGDPVTARTDLYALGCVLFTLASGSPPFRGDTALAVCSQHLHTEPPRLIELVPSVPAALSTLVNELLEKDPTRRPADAQAVGDRIALIGTAPLEDDLTIQLQLPHDVTATREYTSTQEHVAPTKPPSPAPSQLLRRDGAVAPLWGSSIASRWRVQDRRRKTWVVAVALAVALVLGIVLSQLGGAPVAPAPPATSAPTTVPGAPPLPSPLVHSLDDLLRSVGS
jgi:serine/threonine-protein kinase